MQYVAPTLPGDGSSGKEGEASEPTVVSRLSGWFSARPDVLAALVYSTLALVGFVVAYCSIFSNFAPYDDEGTLLTTVRAFADGDLIYRDVYSPYGPFYYEVFSGLFALTGWQVTTDASRLLVVVMWILASGLYGFIAHRLTGRLALGAAGFVVAFAVLGALVHEPMHPHGIALVAVAAFLAVVAFGPGRRPWIGGAIGGAMLAGLLLTKVNMGIFGVAAAVLAATLAYPPLRQRRWVLWPVLVAFMLTPLAVAARDLGEAWVRDLVLLETFAFAALVVAATATHAPRRPDDSRLGEWIAGAVGGLAAAGAVILGLLLVLGLSPGEIYEALVVEALGIRDAFVLPLALPTTAIDWSLAAFAFAIVAAWASRRRRGLSPAWEGVLRVVAGLTVWFAITGAAPLRTDPDVSNLALPLALAWVAALPPALATEESAFKRFLRIAIPAVAIAQVLQIYPVAGNQREVAAVTFVPVGALCIADGLAILSARMRERGSEAYARLGVVVLVLSVALAGKLVLDSMLRPGVSAVQTYRSQQPLSFEGAGRVRLPAPQAEQLEAVVALLREHQCTTFVSVPSLNSFYLWADLKAPSPQLPGPWMMLLGDERQREAIADLRDERRPCAIRLPSQADGWLQGRDPSEKPLYRYFERNFVTVAEAGEYEFMLPRGEVARD